MAVTKCEREGLTHSGAIEPPIGGLLCRDPTKSLINFDRNETLPQWKYDIRPRATFAPAARPPRMPPRLRNHAAERALRVPDAANWPPDGRKLAEIAPTNCPSPHQKAKLFQSALLGQSEDWWGGAVERVPGIDCQGRTREQLLESLTVTLREALEDALLDDAPAIGARYERAVAGR